MDMEEEVKPFTKEEFKAYMEESEAKRKKLKAEYKKKEAETINKIRNGKKQSKKPAQESVFESGPINRAKAWYSR